MSSDTTNHANNKGVGVRVETWENRPLVDLGGEVGPDSDDLALREMSLAVDALNHALVGELFGRTDAVKSEGDKREDVKRAINKLVETSFALGNRLGRAPESPVIDGAVAFVRNAVEGGFRSGPIDARTWELVGAAVTGFIISERNAGEDTRFEACGSDA